MTSPITDGFDPSPALPHGDGLLTPLQLARKGSRFAVFVGAGVFGRDQRRRGRSTSPRPSRSRASSTSPSSSPTRPATPSFEIGFEWDERETYAVRVWLPTAFAALDRDGEPSSASSIRILLDRHRAAGVHVYVEFTDPRWILGTGIVRDLDTDDALGIAVAGTEAWTDDDRPTDRPARRIAVTDHEPIADEGA